MKKRVLSLLLCLCMAAGLFPSALAAESSGTADAAKLELSGKARTDTGMRVQVNLVNPPESYFLYAMIYKAAAEGTGGTGQMKEFKEVTLSGTGDTVTLDNVDDTDTVKLCLLDAALKPLYCEKLSRPQDGGVNPDEFESFAEQLMSMIRPDFLSAAAIEDTEAKAATDDYAYKRLIVKSQEKLPDLSDYGKPRVITDTSTSTSILQFGTEENAKSCQAYLESLPSVQYVEPDMQLKSGPKASDSFLGADSADYKSWGVKQIYADVMANYLKANGGKPVTVAVVDTGVDAAHSFLKDRVLPGIDYYDNDYDPTDEHSHGTHVSGTIVDCTQGLSNIKILPVRVMGPTGGGSTAAVVLGINYAVAQGANVINLSLGGKHSNYLDEAVQNAIAKGIIVVVAAGNEGSDASNHCPAHVEEAITVGAVDSKNARASFSNYGKPLDVTAPGVKINSSILNNDFGEKSGTSMSTPHVAAAVAMIKSAYPDKTPAQIQEALKYTATDLGDKGWDEYNGAGLVNLAPFTKGTWPDKPDDSKDDKKDDDKDKNEHEYELFETGMVWADAKAYCEKLGGHLMTVNSAEEQKILEKLLEEEGTRNSYWLGGYRTDSGAYAWVTGEAFSYTNWAPGEPNRHHNTEDKLMAYRGKNPMVSENALGQWNDLDADGTCQSETFFGLKNFGFICEWNSKDDIVDPKPEPEPGIYAVLYGDGELVFQNDDQPRQKKSYIAVYPVDGAILQDAEPAAVSHTHSDGSTEELMFTDYANWYKYRKQITSVSIVNKIQPTTTALWFLGCENLEKVTGLEWLDTSKVKDMSHMFSDCGKLTELDVSAFNTASVTNMSHMFFGCEKLLSLDLESFDTSKVTDMDSMFSGCKELERVYAKSSFVTASVTKSGYMFEDCFDIVGTIGTKYDKTHIDKLYARLDSESAPGYLTDKSVIPGKANVFLYSDGEMVFQRSGVQDAKRTLVESWVIDVKEREVGHDYARWYNRRAEVKTVTFADTIRPYATSQWFYGMTNLTKINNIDRLDTRLVDDMSQMFGDCGLTSLDLSKLNTQSVTTMKGMFQDCVKLASLNLTGFDTSRVTNMSSMFDGCESLASLDLSSFNTARVQNMSNMFRECKAMKTLNVSSFKTGSLTNMSYMFRGAGMTSLDLSGFSTSLVTKMDCLFEACANLTSVNLGSFDTRKVTTMKAMFSGCAALKSLDLSGFQTTSVETMEKMFAGSGLVTLNLAKDNKSGWNTNKVTNMSGMFSDCAALTTINVKTGTFGTSAVTSSDKMFSGCTALKGGRGTAFNASYTDKAYARVDYGTRQPGYFTDPNLIFLTFDANDSSDDRAKGTMAEEILSKNVAFTLKANTFTREWYAFTGWNTKRDGTGTSYKDKASVTFTADTTLYAQWEHIKIVVTYNANDTSADPASGKMEAQVLKKNVPGTLNANTYTREWYNFTGWNTKADGSGTSYKDKATVTFTKDTTLYAQWEYMKVIVSFNGNGSTEDPVAGTMSSQVFRKRTAAALNANTFTREGYDFQGWNTKPDGSGTKYTDKQSAAFTQDTTLYAQWAYSYLEHFYAVLYSDGDLVIQWNSKTDPNRTAVKVYETDRAGYSDNRDAQDNYRAWYNERNQIKTVTFAKRVQPDDIAQWFAGCENLKTIRNWQKLDTSLVKDMSELFWGCTSLESVDLQTFNTSKVENLNSMFEGCEKLVRVNLRSFETGKVSELKNMFKGCQALTTIYATDKFAVSKDAADRQMFRDCDSLVGGKGTKYDSGHVDAEYAHVDGGTSNPGYFTAPDAGLVGG